MARLHLDILSPEKEIFNGDVLYIKLPGSLCPFEMLPDHAPIVSSLDAGKIVYAEAGAEQEASRESVIEMTGGFVEKTGDTVTICIS